MGETTNTSAFEARMLSGVSAIPREVWSAMFPADAEGWDYYRACEAAPPPAFRFSAIAVYRGETIVAAAPVFRLTYRLDTPLQGRWRPLGEWLANTIPRLFKIPAMGLGSPLADRCHLGFAPQLSLAEKQAAMATLIDGVFAYAVAERIEILAVKDLADRDLGAAEAALLAARYVRVASLPVAVLDLPFASEDAYLASLSASTRKDIRRKLKGASRIRLEMRHSIADIEDQIVALYDETRGQSGFDYGDFEKLSPAYFRDVIAGLGERAVVMLYWLDAELIGFNLLFVEGDRVIDKFIGMRYPVAREHNLYVLSWMANVRFCLDRGIGQFQTGQTAYASKVRFGSRLDKSWVYFRHRVGFWNAIVHAVGPFMAFDKMDPDLVALAKKDKVT